MPEIRVQTDENGHFHKTKKYNPPIPDFIPGSIRVELTAKLISPAETEVVASLDIDAVNGSPSNQEKEFVLNQGELVHLGSWRIDHDDNLIRCSGLTRPARPNVELVIAVDKV